MRVDAVDVDVAGAGAGAGGRFFAEISLGRGAAASVVCADQRCVLPVLDDGYNHVLDATATSVSPPRGSDAPLRDGNGECCTASMMLLSTTAVSCR
jgi:hypothetical protein